MPAHCEPASGRRFKRDSRGRREESPAPNTGESVAISDAAAIQDHWRRVLNMPGGGAAKMPSLKPGSSMTLAQRRGLIESPKPVLTTSQWQEVQATSRARESASACSTCPICLEDFRSGSQVLLSCSHVFHRQCLASFERHARVQCCPICRAEWYQKKQIQDGQELARHAAARTIQAAWRGHQQRQIYLNQHWLTRPPTDPVLRHKWCADRLERESDHLAAREAERTQGIDDLFAELDASVAASRAVMRRTEPAAVRAVVDRIRSQDLYGSPDQRRSSTPDAAPLFPGRSCADLRQAAGLECSSRGGGSDLMQPDEEGVVWGEVMAQAEARGDHECSICLGDIGAKGSHQVAWLSCSHSFHWGCITAFEAFEIGTGGTPTCPVCRQEYSRRGAHDL